MRTEDLINDLAERLTPVPPLWMERRLAGWDADRRAFVGGRHAVGWLGLRPDLAAASLTGMFWVKFAYVLGLSLAGAGAALSLGRPGGRGTRGFALAFGLVAVLALVAAVSSLSAPVEARHRMMMGHSARLCPWFILAMSLPVLGSALIALRGMAPTRPALGRRGGGALGRRDWGLRLRFLLQRKRRSLHRPLVHGGDRGQRFARRDFGALDAAMVRT